MSPGFVWASIRAATTAGGGGGASRSKNGRLNPGSARTRDARPAMTDTLPPAGARRSGGYGVRGGAALCPRSRTRAERLALVGLVELFLEGFVGRRLGRQ